MAAARVTGNADMPLDVVAATPVGTVPSKMADEGCSSSSMASTHDIEKPEVQHVSLDPVTVGPNVRPVSTLFESMRWHDPSQAPPPPKGLIMRSNDTLPCIWSCFAWIYCVDIFAL